MLSKTIYQNLQWDNLEISTYDNIGSGTTNLEQALTITGNVGIGTTTPSEVLSVNGNVSIEGTNCRDSGGSATCNNFVDIAELFDSSEPVDSGDVVVIDFEQPSTRNPDMTLAAKNIPKNPESTGKYFQNPVGSELQNSVGTELQNPVDSQFQNSVDNKSDFKVRKSAQPYDKKVVGIVSTQPAIVIEGGRIVAMGGWKGQNSTMKPAVALAGRVPVKVTDENGHIKKGDLLTTSSKPGYAMKFDLIDERTAKSFEELKEISYNNSFREGAVLGKALEDCGQQECKILAFVSMQ